MHEDAGTTSALPEAAVRSRNAQITSSVEAVGDPLARESLDARSLPAVPAVSPAFGSGNMCHRHIPAVQLDHHALLP